MVLILVLASFSEKSWTFQHVMRTSWLLIHSSQDPSALQQPQCFLSMLLMANLSMWVSSLKVALIASWLPSDWGQSQGEDRNGLLEFCGHLHSLPMELLYFHMHHGAVTYRKFTMTFPRSIFSYYKLWKIQQQGEQRDVQTNAMS